MNYIKHLTGFFEKVTYDFDFNPTHISLYIAMFQAWNLNRFINPISITRDELMRISKISSKATYHKCIKELTEKGYIIYKPSFNPYKGSTAEIINLDYYTKPMTKKLANKLKNEQLVEQEVNKQCTSTEQVYIDTNNANISNSINDINNQSQQIEKLNFQPDFTSEHQSKKKLREKKRYNPDDIPPIFEEVQKYFIEKNGTIQEAEKFFNYYTSKGWLVGGNSKMKDWKASARNWILNTEKFKPKNTQPQANHLHTSNHKNYGEPL
ncbi:transcriptional regulator [Flavobacterium sp.]|uniref:transcriptional regulator n=1 Tax=Flavobacterium sp. TaxID=239 RepID=UPI00286DC697|nr:transcriptional regulator [Flavobacterium sp.]